MLKLSHKNLDIYKILLLLVNEIYAITKTFPNEDRFVLVSYEEQLCRFPTILLKEHREYLL